MDIKLNKKFLSLDHIEWNNIPKFVVITGPNGTGKSQLLQLLRSHIPSKNASLSVSGFEANENEIVLIPDNWNIPTREAAISNPVPDANNLFNKFSTYAETNIVPADLRSNHGIIEMFDELVELGKGNEGVSFDKFKDRYMLLRNHPSDFLSEGLANIFARYQFNYLDKVKCRDGDEISFKELFDEPPWIVLNEIFVESGLPFQVTNPERHGFGEKFELEIINSKKEKIKPSQLSSGEKVIISVMFWLYHSKQNTRLPKLILLDEPDAHLHPSLARKFLDVINNTLVKKHDIRVIMTTHSPTTVAFTPDESLFEMAHTHPRIKKATSKNDAIHNLTDGFVVVTDNTRYILVEDVDDVRFYTEIFRIMSQSEKDDSGQQLIFIPASKNNKNKTNGGGGRNEIEKWIPKLTESDALSTMFYGLVDRDFDENTPDNIFLINRHSMENYLSDPLVVYGCLLDQEKAPQIRGLSFSYGDENHFYKLEESSLQKIADSIIELLDRNGVEHHDEFGKRNIVYNTGQTINVPEWLFTTRGKDIFSEYYKVFGGEYVNHDKLFKSFQRIRLIPQDLISVIEDIKNAELSKVGVVWEPTQNIT